MEYYLWIKAGHIISMVAWMAGMLYLPRLFVYHAEAGQQSPMAATFQTMEHRLLRYITNPAMIATWGFGIWMLVLNPDLLQQGWVHAKLTLVLVLSGVHGMLARYRKQLLAGTCSKSPTFFRVLNEAPTVILITVAILAVTKPF